MSRSDAQSANQNHYHLSSVAALVNQSGVIGTEAQRWQTSPMSQKYKWMHIEDE